MLYRTTVRIDDELLADLKALAARQHRTLNSVMEEAFRRMIAAAREQEQRPKVELPTSGRPGDPHPTWAEIRCRSSLPDTHAPTGAGPNTASAILLLAQRLVRTLPFQVLDRSRRPA